MCSRRTVQPLSKWPLRSASACRAAGVGHTQSSKVPVLQLRLLEGLDQCLCSVAAGAGGVGSAPHWQGLLNGGLCDMLVANSLLQKQEGDDLCSSRRRYVASEELGHRAWDEAHPRPVHSRAGQAALFAVAIEDARKGVAVLENGHTKVVLVRTIG